MSAIALSSGAFGSAIEKESGIVSVFVRFSNMSVVVLRVHLFFSRRLRAAFRRASVDVAGAISFFSGNNPGGTGRFVAVAKPCSTVLIIASLSTARSRALRTSSAESAEDRFVLKYTPKILNSGVCDITTFSVCIEIAFFGVMECIDSIIPELNASMSVCSFENSLIVSVFIYGDPHTYDLKGFRMNVVGIPDLFSIIVLIWYGPAPMGLILREEKANCSAVTFFQ